MNRDPGIRFFLIEAGTDWAGQPQWGYDLQISDPDLTAATYLTAQAAFCGQQMAACRGCDGCCHERAPLIAADLPVLGSLLPASPFPAQAVVSAFGQIAISPEGAVDICLRRPAGDCLFLNQGEKCCRQHAQRPLVCRSYFCLPQSPRAHALREALINWGEDRLVTLLLAEEAQGGASLLPGVTAADYPPYGPECHLGYERILLRKVCSPELWQELGRP